MNFNYFREDILPSLLFLGGKDMKSLFFNVKGNEFEIIETMKPDLQLFYKKIECDCIDISCVCIMV